ncbi:cytochrome P450 family protein, putative [Rhizoctonia solani AG-3 Rhs1AP]|uniref:Cytochrome P450 family protein, putative n=1 Tax=Rhizoctonia solani AG-3 Rhs1AP TaxID=1086054 RepID=X8J911_9AGAM|nr:cytochrome P450 family protein, putative [Rhizoctonia solani AG-3 Rhs1AP]
MSDLSTIVPNLFRLLDLADEHGSGGIIEKVVIDQLSLHRLLNIVQPGSYDSVSRINFKALDQLSIRPIGVYGTQSEIIKFLQQTQYIDENFAILLSQTKSSNDASSALRSGLYLALDPSHQDQGALKAAYIIYWPEHTTWDDQAASSSVRRNRVTFMRYLNKLAEQTISLVSSAQARALIWDTNAHSQYLPGDQQENSGDAWLFNFEVAKSPEQEENAIGSSGFTVIVESRLLPQANNRAESRVQLVPGEQKTALLVVKDEKEQPEEKHFDNNISPMNLRKTIESKECPILLGNLTPTDIEVLATHGLRSQHKTIFVKYDGQLRALNAVRARQEEANKRLIEDQINRDRPKIREEIQHLVRISYDRLYPSPRSGFDPPHGVEVTAPLYHRYPSLNEVTDEIVEKLEIVQDRDFQLLKGKWPFLKGYLETNPRLSDDEHETFVNDILREPNAGIRADASPLPAINSTNISDAEFVSQLRKMGQTYFSLFGLIRRVYSILGRNLETLKNKVIVDQLDKVVSTERERQSNAASATSDQEYLETTRHAFEVLMQELREAMATNAWGPSNSQYFACNGGVHYSRYDALLWAHAKLTVAQFRWSGRITSIRPAQTHHTLYPLELTAQDIQLCRVSETHVPQPKVDTRHKFEFTLAKGWSVEFIQLIRERCLVVVSGKGETRIYVEDSVTMNHAVNTTHGKVTLSNESLGGPRRKFAFDQAARLLAIVHGHDDDPKLSIYIFDELFTNLRSRGSPICLRGWYDNKPDFKHVCFASGEEICLVEAAGRARIFSLITQQFRHVAASLQIDRPIIDAFSAPDGSCLFVIVPGEGTHLHRLLAFHWASFGSNKKGIDSTGLRPRDGYRIATRFDGRGRVHVVSFDAASKAITSVVLQITQKPDRLPFGGVTRFPVVPAVARNTLTVVERRPRQLIFASPVGLECMKDYFTRMISTFEATTRKPTGETLATIEVKSTSDVGRDIVAETSEFKLGSFIVELLCLIPLHLAVARKNRFIPLKDGVWDPEYERSLLGADVPAIVDALSLGWYESLLQSYMATKHVEKSANEAIVGEKSVGKSYCLNHFADTSFTGSVTRTTEGVWLSCTPTEEYLLVSLDFEGVHSIERSVQEDALLALFNTAISNLVLFRNNFATPSDIAGLFTSLQFSATVLDPNVNRGLFNSTLAIIIKDVTNAESIDIVRQFFLKLQGIVEKEKDQNFITRLHRGHIQIIRWPVINSPSLYTLFGRLHQGLDQQPYTHGSGGAFLHNLKTLMAKIKTSDWGPMDQNVAAHRAQQLMEKLPTALSCGRHEEGPLKNMDADAELETPDYMPLLFVPEFATDNVAEGEVLAEQALRALVQTYDQTIHTRYQVPDALYVETLQKSIDETIEQRVALVQKWVSVNIERFPSGNQDIRNIKSKLQAAFLGMKNVARMCSSGCSSCQLLCLRAYRHSGEHSCGTSHRCIFDCEVAEEHLQREPCGLPAGHEGRHMCDVKAHSCGLECHLSSKGGCAQSCIKPLDHEGEHTCSARVHICGKPCDLRNVRQGINGGVYSCPGTCTSLWDESHERHACDNRACPIECVLCRRLCCNTDHFHGLVPGDVHLCGQEHNCTKLCEADGICQIETRPSAIQEQFSGRHETFMYTRFTQVDRRLSCTIPIPPGELSHEGVHTHDTGENAFHFCNVRCPNCEYLCGLPYDHGQQLHETSHGSMITTQWVLQSDKDDSDPMYELQGRKFGSGDEGAPMLCNLVCAAQGRHAHIDYCRDPDSCSNTDCEHITERMHPGPDRQKDWISHATFWARSDPYPNEEQTEFLKCDVLCAGPEHEASATAPANHSYCTLPIFHAPEPQQPAPLAGHISIDGHAFDCQNPSRMNQAYHILFVIDSSGSMYCRDRQPLPDTPISARLVSECNNRYGAVLSALHGFWLSREAVASSTVTLTRQDAYSVITFASSATTRVQNDFTSTTDQLISHLLPQGDGGTNFDAALKMSQSLIETHWSSDRAPVIIFLSDGECGIADNTVYDLCHFCVRQGKALAFHSVSFGPDTSSSSLRRMADIAHEVFASAPQDVLTAARGNPCAYTRALDSVQLADTFLGIANSLQKPRASLMNQYGSGGRRAMY